MKLFCQVISTPTADTPGTSVLLHFPDKRYIFGQLSEGTQRACTSRGVRLALLSDVFITGRTEWANTGGLTGMILTLADTVATANASVEETRKKKASRNNERKQTREHGKAYANWDGRTVLQEGNLTVHGGMNITHTLATARRFVFRKGMPVFVKEYDSETMASQASTSPEDPFETPSWSDSNIKVWALPIRPTPAHQSFVNTKSQSPRKRNLDEFQESQTEEHLDQRARDLLTTQAIVQDMFNSNWKMDTLHEVPLAEVQMPATIFVRNPETKDLEHYKGPVPGDEQPLPDLTVFVRKPWPSATVKNLPKASPSKEALSYVVRSYDIRGKFDAQKAYELNVPRGAKFSALTRGESVESDSGKIVTPDMVLGQPKHGKGIAIIDLPSPEYVEELVTRAEWKSPAVTTGLQAFVWILGPGVAEHPKFKKFVASRPDCEHLVSGTDQCPNYLALSSVASSTVQLASLRPDTYSVPVHDNVTLPQIDSSNAGSESAIAARQNSPLTPAIPGLIIEMEPKTGLNREEVTEPFNPANAVNRIPRAVQQRLEVTNKRVAKPDFQKMLKEQRAEWPGTDVEIIALGTGSAVPSKYRNVSATLVKVPGVGNYLLDCGENTLGQLKRVFEPEELRDVLQNLRMIWISHLHADHHLGTTSVIKAWYKENFKDDTAPAVPEPAITKILQEKRLAVVSDAAMISWLTEYSEAEDFGFHKLLTIAAYPVANGSDLSTLLSHRLPSGDFAQLSFTDTQSPVTPLLKAATGLEDLLTCRVRHCAGALAVSLVFPDGFKVSYSGDCRPSVRFTQIGQCSTVLIHEATFQDDMSGSAIAKRHSTSAEALEVGRRMQARAILLTHFSQRYQKIAYSGKGPETGPKPRELVDRRFMDGDNPLGVPQDPLLRPSPDDIMLPRNKSQIIPYEGPVVGAMDYMRIKVGDFALAQAYAPTLEKLIDLLERASIEDAERAKREKEAIDLIRMENNRKKKLFGQAGAAAAAALATAAANDAEAEAETEAQKPPRSVWSASESEDGWETSDVEL